MFEGLSNFTTQTCCHYLGTKINKLDGSKKFNIKKGNTLGLLYVTVLAKTGFVLTKTEFNFIAAVYRHTQYLSIPSVSSVKC